LESITTPNGDREFTNIDPQGRITSIKSEDNIKHEITWVSDQAKQLKWYDSDNSVIGVLDFEFRNDVLRVNSISLNSIEYANYSDGDVFLGGMINNQISCAKTGFQNTSCLSSNGIHLN